MTAALHLAATYQREVRAGIQRVWENVFDWEHLPGLHEGYFAAVTLLETNASGWRVALSRQPGGPDREVVLALDADRQARRYCVRILEGDGAGTEIWTELTPLGPRSTAVAVRFLLPETDPQKRARLGDAYRRTYQRLWDEDEAMMRRREALSRRRVARPRRPLPLGPVAELRRRLPLLVEHEGCPIRILELDGGAIVAHPTICPHWLGPLEECAPRDGVVRCPWHGYRFDLRTGESADGRGYRLHPAMRVAVDAATGEAILLPIE